MLPRRNAIERMKNMDFPVTVLGTTVQPGTHTRADPAVCLSAPSPAEILATAQSARTIIQDFRPLAESIEWELGQFYLRERGSGAFLRDPEPVPFVVNNDGNFSVNAAEVLFASLLAAERDGTLEPDIFILELGIGVGLFARFFLDAFRVLCARHSKDYYDRLCYVAADRSEKMLLDAGRHGIFANHPGRYILRVADALCPEETLLQDSMFGDLAPHPFRAVFLNYLLDCLPATVLKMEGDGVAQLCVRTCISRGANLSEFTDVRVEELARMASSPNPAERRELLEVYEFLASEYDFRPVDLAQVAYGDFAVRQAKSGGHRSIVNSHGALQCLERLIGLLRQGGFILINEYGQAQAADAEGFEHQRFSDATFVGINIPLLREYFASIAEAQWAEPEQEGAGILSRLLGKQVVGETVARFKECFGKETQEWRQEPAHRARELIKHGRLEAAVTAYRRALERQPYNWSLMNEVAHFLTFPLENPLAGLEMARAALACNPNCSAELWNMAGDSLFALGRIAEAEKAFQHALRINPDDARARFNLAFVYTQTRQFSFALDQIAKALALDRAGAYRERLLQKQTEILTRLERRHQQHYKRMSNRVSTASYWGVPETGTR